MDVKYFKYGLLTNIFVLVSVLLASKTMFVKETMDSISAIVTIFFIGLLYYMYKKFGNKVAYMVARFILDIYPRYLMKYENKNRLIRKIQKDLTILTSTDNIFVLIKYNLYVVVLAFVFNAMSSMFDNFSQVFVYFLIVDILLLMIVITCSWYRSFKVIQQYK